MFTRNYYTVKAFIIGGRLFLYIMKGKGPKIDPWGTPCFTVPYFEENFSNHCVSVFVSCLSDRI
jgi:hypothetical protein